MLGSNEISPNDVLTDALRRLARADVTTDLSSVKTVKPEEKTDLDDVQILHLCYQRFGDSVGKLRADIQGRGVDGELLEKFDGQVLQKVSYGGKTDTGMVVDAVTHMGLDKSTQDRMLTEHLVNKLINLQNQGGDDDVAMIKTLVGDNFEAIINNSIDRVEKESLDSVSMQFAIFEEGKRSPQAQLKDVTKELRQRFLPGRVSVLQRRWKN